jgi:hypothetical protein
MSRKIHRAVVCPLFALAVAAPRARAADLQPQTVAAFDRYVRLTERRMGRELDGSTPFLWVDSLPDAQRHDAYRRLQQNEIVVGRLETRDAGRSIDVPKGICHHWIGTMLARGVALQRVVRLMQNYDRYQDVYKPAIRRSKMLARTGNQYSVSLQLFMTRVLSVVLNTEYEVQYRRVADRRMHVRSYTTRIAEVADATTPEEHEKPIGHDNGFLWRFYNYCSLEERDEGTYVQCETLSLSRDVPIGLGWLIGPFVSGIPRDSLEFTLGAMRAALTGASTP